MIDNKKSTDLGKLAREYNRRCELEASVWLIERLQAENANLKSKLENRDLNISHLTKLLKLAGTVRINIEKTIENSAKPCPECNYEEWVSQEDTTCLESNSCAHCDVEMEYLYEHEKRETCRRCENILEQDPAAFQ